MNKHRGYIYYKWYDKWIDSWQMDRLYNWVDTRRNIFLLYVEALSPFPSFTFSLFPFFSFSQHCRTLKPTGWFFLTVPTQKFLFVRLHSKSHQKSSYQLALRIFWVGTVKKPPCISGWLYVWDWMVISGFSDL
jgi:hypothetical protein